MITKKTKIVLKKGNRLANEYYTGLKGEVTADIESKELRLHDGVTQGGTVIGRMREVDAGVLDMADLPPLPPAGFSSPIRTHVVQSGINIDSELDVVFVDRTGTALKIEFGQGQLVNTIEPIALGEKFVLDPYTRTIPKLVGGRPSPIILLSERGELWGMGLNYAGMLGELGEPVVDVHPEFSDIFDTFEEQLRYTTIVGVGHELKEGTLRKHITPMIESYSLYKGSPGYIEDLTPIAPSMRFIDVHVSVTHVTAIDTDHCLWSWGYGFAGTFGDDREMISYEPVLVDDTKTWVRIEKDVYSAGVTVAYADDGVVYRTGRGFVETLEEGLYIGITPVGTWKDHPVNKYLMTDYAMAGRLNDDGQYERKGNVADRMVDAHSNVGSGSDVSFNKHDVNYPIVKGLRFRDITTYGPDDTVIERIHGCQEMVMDEDGKVSQRMLQEVTEEDNFGSLRNYTYRNAGGWLVASDVWIRAYNDSGVVLWSLDVGGSSTSVTLNTFDSGHDLITTPSRQVLIDSTGKEVSDVEVGDAGWIDLDLSPNRTLALGDKLYVYDRGEDKVYVVSIPDLSVEELFSIDNKYDVLVSVEEFNGGKTLLGLSSTSEGATPLVVCVGPEGVEWTHTWERRDGTVQYVGNRLSGIVAVGERIFLINEDIAYEGIRELNKDGEYVRTSTSYPSIHTLQLSAVRTVADGNHLYITSSASGFFTGAHTLTTFDINTNTFNRPGFMRLPLMRTGVSGFQRMSMVVGDTPIPKDAKLSDWTVVGDPNVTFTNITLDSAGTGHALINSDGIWGTGPTSSYDGLIKGERAISSLAPSLLAKSENLGDGGGELTMSPPTTGMIMFFLSDGRIMGVEGSYMVDVIEHVEWIDPHDTFTYIDLFSVYDEATGKLIAGILGQEPYTYYTD